VKTIQKQIVVLVVMLVSAVSADAAVVNGVNWADNVAAYSANIQNYGGTLMTTATEFWVLGPSDADADGNDYAWDAGDPDYVAGWRANAPDEYLVVEWILGLSDNAGDDLTIRLYGGSSASANVLASTDGVSYTQIGTLGGGTPGYFRDETFDFAGQFGGDVHFVKVERVGNGSNTGVFFDSFGGAVPEPTTLALLAAGGLLLRMKRHASGLRDLVTQQRT
jgi:hypothetical protein